MVSCAHTFSPLVYSNWFIHFSIKVLWKTNLFKFFVWSLTFLYQPVTFQFEVAVCIPDFVSSRNFKWLFNHATGFMRLPPKISLLSRSPIGNILRGFLTPIFLSSCRVCQVVPLRVLVLSGNHDCETALFWLYKGETVAITIFLNGTLHFQWLPASLNSSICIMPHLLSPRGSWSTQYSSCSSYKWSSSMCLLSPGCPFILGITSLAGTKGRT